MFVKWSEALMVGVEEIDKEHQSIIEEFEKLYALMRVGTGHDFYPLVVDFLEAYIQSHLDHEEKLQVEIGYPDVVKHKELHQHFRDKVAKLKVDQAEKKISNEDLLALNHLIKDWFVDHIVSEDMKIAAFMREKK